MRHETTGKDGDWKRVRGDKDVVKVKYDNTGIDFADNKECFGIGPGYFKLRSVATASLPVSPDEGAFLYDSTLKAPVFHNGTDYKTLSAFGSEVSLTDIEDITSDRILGRDTAGSGAVEQLTVGNGLEFTGSGGIGIADFATGSWSPVLQAASGTIGSPPYTDQIGRYFRIGDFMYVFGRLTINDFGTLSGNASIGGLPETAASLTNVFPPISIGFATGLNITAGHSVAGYVDDGSTDIILRLWDDTAGNTTLQISEMGSIGSLSFSGFYLVA